MSKVRCDPCDMVHDGPLCVCGEPLFLKGPVGFVRWTHVHTRDGDHEPRPDNDAPPKLKEVLGE